MAFVNEWVSKDDIEKYELEKFYKICSQKNNNYIPVINNFQNKIQWTVDRNRDIWLTKICINKITDVPPVYPGDDIYLLYNKGKYFEVMTKKNSKESSTKYSDKPFKIRLDILSISPLNLNSFRIKEIVRLIQEAMETYGLDGVVQYDRFPMKEGLDLDIQVRYRGE